MKLRKGFVSNSSSSSFIVGFPKKPENVEELQKIMFGDLDIIWDGWGDEKYQTKKIAESVFREFETAKDVEEWDTPEGIVTRKQAEKELDNYYDLYPWSTSFYGGFSKHGFSREQIIEVFGENYEETKEFKQWKKLWEEINGLHDSMFESRSEKLDKEDKLKTKANEIVNEFIKNNRKDIFEAPMILLVEYADDCGQGFMEHGEIFRNLPHIRISKH